MDLLKSDERKDNRQHQWKRAQLTQEQISSLIADRERKKAPADKLIMNLIASTSAFLSHSYLAHLHDSYYPTIAKWTQSDDPDACSQEIDDRLGAIDITKWVTNPEEDPLDKLANFYQVFSKEKCNIALIINRKPDRCRFYLAVCNTGEDRQPGIIDATLLPRAKNSLKGNFPGVTFGDDNGIEVVKTIKSFLQPADKNADQDVKADRIVAVVSSLASEKSEKFLSQTIEKLLDGMVPQSLSEEYTVMMLATPVFDFANKAKQIADAYTALSAQAVIQKSSTLSESASVSSSATKGFSVGGGLSAGVSAGVGVGPAKVDAHVNVHIHADGHWDSTMGEVRGVDSSNGTTLTYTNYDVKYVLDLLEKATKRLEQCKATGMWNYAAYVISRDEPTAKNVAHMYAALIQGEESYLEESAINVWTSADEYSQSDKKSPSQEDEMKSVDVILECLSQFQHPAFVLKEDTGERHSFPLVTDATNLFSTIELAHAMNFPRKSVAGFPVTECAAFGRSVSLLDGAPGATSIEVGDIWHMRQNDGGKVKLGTNLLTSHVFITGSTGSGKSNTVYQLLDKLTRQDRKKFLVIEPTKGEYRTVFGGRDDVEVYGTNPENAKLLRINPFSFPNGVQLYTHLDRLIDIFNTCWPMYAAMPAVLKDAIERAYIEAGWDLRTSKNPYGRLFPSFGDVLRQIDIVMNDTDYSGDSKGDYKGALKTRLKSLTNGIYDLVFSCDELTESELFDENVIVELSETGPETTSLIMGILVLKLREYRMVSKAKNEDLKHITVLEEAHNLLKRTSTEQYADGSNLVGKSVEMITNAIAEMRTYGESFFIVDQAPGALDPAAIRNTNTKIVLRLPDLSDRELVGKAIGLNDYQIVELSKLERGVAAVYQSGWIESVLCKFKEFKEKRPLNASNFALNLDNSAGILINAVVYGQQFSEFAGTIKALKNKLVAKSNLPISLKRTILEICDSETTIGDEQLGKLAYELLDGDKLCSADGKVSEVNVRKQFDAVLKTYQIQRRNIELENLKTLTRLIELEHQRREKEWTYGVLTGGVR